MPGAGTDHGQPPKLYFMSDRTVSNGQCEGISESNRPRSLQTTFSCLRVEHRRTATIEDILAEMSCLLRRHSKSGSGLQAAYSRLPRSRYLQLLPRCKHLIEAIDACLEPRPSLLMLANMMYATMETRVCTPRTPSRCWSIPLGD